MLDSVNIERLLTSTVHRVSHSTSSSLNLNAHWINSGLCPAHWTSSVSGGLMEKGLAGSDAQFPRDD